MEDRVLEATRNRLFTTVNLNRMCEWQQLKPPRSPDFADHQGRLKVTSFDSATAAVRPGAD